AGAAQRLLVRQVGEIVVRLVLEDRERTRDRRYRSGDGGNAPGGRGHRSSRGARLLVRGVVGAGHCRPSWRRGTGRACVEPCGPHRDHARLAAVILRTHRRARDHGPPCRTAGAQECRCAAASCCWYVGSVRFSRRITAEVTGIIAYWTTTL